MKLEIESECRRKLAEIGNDAMMVIVVSSRRKLSGEGPLMGREGPRCRFVGETAPGRWLVDIRADKLLAYLTVTKPVL